jgi:hypothetical protein
MPEQKSKFLSKILAKGAEKPGRWKSFTSERQHTAQAFNLHVERRDGRRTEGFAWSHYVGYQWTDEGESRAARRRLRRARVEIEGHNLGVLVMKSARGS